MVQDKKAATQRLVQTSLERNSKDGGGPSTDQDIHGDGNTIMVTLFIISKRQEETEMKGQKTNEKRDTEEG